MFQWFRDRLRRVRLSEDALTPPFSGDFPCIVTACEKAPEIVVSAVHVVDLYEACSTVFMEVEVEDEDLEVPYVDKERWSFEELKDGK